MIINLRIAKIDSSVFSFSVISIWIALVTRQVKSSIYRFSARGALVKNCPR